LKGEATIKKKKITVEKFLKNDNSKTINLLKSNYLNKHNPNTRIVIDGDVYDERYEDYDCFYDSYHLDNLFI